MFRKMNGSWGGGEAKGENFIDCKEVINKKKTVKENKMAICRTKLLFACKGYQRHILKYIREILELPL